MSTRGTMPRHIDSQPQIFWWEMDEFLAAFMVFGIGVIVGRWVALLGLAGAWVVVRAMRRWKEGELDGGLPHIIYSFGVHAINDVYQDALKKDFFK